MTNRPAPILAKVILISLALIFLLLACALFGLSTGSTGFNFAETLALLTGSENSNPIAATILWEIRLPRIILSAAAGASLALGGLVFQAILRNPLAEPYILGISGGSAIGAILGMLAGLSVFPGVPLMAFVGSMLTLCLIVAPTTRQTLVNSNSLLLGGVMVNAFCGAVIMLLISITRASKVHNILFWLMGDLSRLTPEGMNILLAILPCILILFILARPMNLLLLGNEAATSLGLNVKRVILSLLIATTLMVSIIVCQAGLIGFVGLVVPHIFRLIIGPDHRLLVPACALGGGSFLIACDLLARTIPAEGEMPVGIVTALIGAPLFLILLWRSGK